MFWWAKKLDVQLLLNKHCGHDLKCHWEGQTNLVSGTDRTVSIESDAATGVILKTVVFCISKRKFWAMESWCEEEFRIVKVFSRCQYTMMYEVLVIRQINSRIVFVINSWNSNVCFIVKSSLRNATINTQKWHATFVCQRRDTTAKIFQKITFAASRAQLCILLNRFPRSRNKRTQV